jgi:hypothetical protein
MGGWIAESGGRGKGGGAGKIGPNVYMEVYAVNK